MENPKKPNFDETKDTLGFIKNGYTFKPMGSFPAVKSDMVEAKGIIVPTFLDEVINYAPTKSENYDASKLPTDFINDEIGQFNSNFGKKSWHIDKIRIQHSKVIHTQDSLDVPCFEDAMRNLAGELICKLPIDELHKMFEFEVSYSKGEIKLTCETK